MNVLGIAARLPTSRLIISPLYSPFKASPSSHIIQQTKSFSSSLINQVRKGNDKYYKILKYVKPIDSTVYQAGQEIPRGFKVPGQKKLVPDYEYETMYFKRQNRGLFGGLQRKRSKNCSEAKNKTLRFHLPNVQKSKLWSETLNKAIQVKVTTKVLKTITKEGGLDKYLLKDKPARTKTLGLLGWKLRYEVLKKQEFNQLPVINNQQVFYIHKDGKQFTVGKYKLLNELYPLVQRDSYYPIGPVEFKRNHNYLTIEEVVNKLEEYSFDFSKVTVA
ncbi:ribosomal L28 family-domain-containing protein [Scheffersomyces coipomensis]|uniref:ribosomal L28 family-domain-containing protein n=1 Tax=Scheffersomyces coipomensis TaxID=1788519 RepID=UPI00315C8F42